MHHDNGWGRHGTPWCRNHHQADPGYRQGGGRGKRYFGRGDVKYALLGQLTDQPMHGYQLMKALEEQSGGLYIPSAGTIYPTLQMLEDQEYVTVSEQEGKKVYSITDAGCAFWQERQDQLAQQQQERCGNRKHDSEQPASQWRPEDGPGLIQLLMRTQRRIAGDAEAEAQFRRIVDNASQELVQLLRSLRERQEQEDPNDLNP